MVPEWKPFKYVREVKEAKETQRRELRRQPRRRVLRIITIAYIATISFWAILDYLSFAEWEFCLLLPLLPLGGWLVWDLTRKYREGI